VLASELIARKRDGGELKPEELQWLLRSFEDGEVTDYQITAFLMAVLFRGMSPAELSVMTRAMIESGTRFDPGAGPPAVDKHSTGGVGDKVSLVLAPLLAEAGLRVPMMAGRGLGHTGGTVDKLESIPGFRTDLSLPEFRAILDETGFAIMSQTSRIAPLDGRLYALRDVSGTVPSVPLIASSIISKKIAEGIAALVLDVKYGSGAFMTRADEALDLARTMVELAAEEGLRSSALVTSMEAPLGSGIGNALEVREAIDCLRGGGPPDVLEVTVELGAELLSMVGAEEPGAARERLAGILASGAAAERFARGVAGQGGDARVVEDPDRLGTAPVQRPVHSSHDGHIAKLDARVFGLAAIELGAGRRRAGESIDPSVGFVLHRRPGDQVATGIPLVTIHAASDDAAESARIAIESAIEITPEPLPELPPLIHSRVSAT
jgi:pyrimidine-nucleoside phosphorylase